MNQKLSKNFRLVAVLVSTLSLLSFFNLQNLSAKASQPIPPKAEKFMAKKQQQAQDKAEKFWQDNVVPGQVIIKFKNNQTISKNQTNLLNLSLKTGTQIIKRPNKKGLALLKTKETSANSTQKIIQEIEKDSAVLYAQPNYKYQKQSQETPWGVTKVKAPDAWAQNNVTGDGAIVAVVDTGVDYQHPDIDANIWTNTDETPNNSLDDDSNGYIDDDKGWDFWSGCNAAEYAPSSQDNDPLDENGHGTHVAGIVAAEDNSQYVVGVAPAAEIMAVKVLDCGGYGTDLTIADGIDYAVNNGAHIINLSLGGYFKSRLLEETINNAVNNGVLVTAAAGNDYWDMPLYPANFEKVISVGATDSDNKITWFSNWGKVDMAAPGVEIESLERDGETVAYSGTSMATPHIAGVAALIKEKNPAFSAAKIRQVLESNLTDLGNANKDIYFGSGLTNALTASDGSYDNSVVITIKNTGYIFADGSDEKEIKATVYNSSLAPVEGENVVFTATNGSINETPTPTDSNGQASQNLTSTAAKNSAKITATSANYGSQTIQIMIKRTDLNLETIWISTSRDSSLTNTFYPGQDVFFMFQMFNYYYDPQEATLEYEVKDESNNVITELSGNFSKTVYGENYLQWEVIEFFTGLDGKWALGEDYAASNILTIPDNLTAGVYTLTGTVTVGAEENSFSSTFTIGQPTAILLVGGRVGGGFYRPYGYPVGNGLTPSHYYFKALSELNQTFTYWNTQLENVSGSDFPNYEDWSVAIVFGDDDYFFSLDGRSYYDEFLAKGGKVFVPTLFGLADSGGESVDNSKPTTFTNIFGLKIANYYDDPEIVSGVADEILADAQLDINWRNWEGDGSADQLSVQEFSIPEENFIAQPKNLNGEVIDSIPATSKPILTLDDDGLAGAKISTEESFKAVYFAFDFGGINSYTDQTEVLGKILDYLSPAPVINSLSQTQIYNSSNYNLLLEGANFSPTGVTTIEIDDSAFEGSFTVNSRNSLTLSIIKNSLALGYHDITVINPDGQEDTLADALKVIQRPKPKIYSVTPSSGYNSKATTISIIGRYFYGNPQVKIGSKYLTSRQRISSRKIVAKVPKGINPGIYSIRVINPDGQSVRKIAAFKVLAGKFLFRKDLYYGMRDNDVRELQLRLKKEGFFPSYLAVADYYGWITRQAVSKYQIAKGIPATGRCDSQTRAKLNAWYTNQK